MPGPPERKEQLRYLHALWKADQEFAHKIVDPMDVEREILNVKECVDCGVRFEHISHKHERCIRCYSAAMESIDERENRRIYESNGSRNWNYDVASDVGITEVIHSIPRSEWFRTEVSKVRRERARDGSEEARRLRLMFEQRWAEEAAEESVDPNAALRIEELRRLSRAAAYARRHSRWSLL